MSTTYFEKSAGQKAAFNPLGVKGIDHIEFIVDSADQWRDFFVEKNGMGGRFFWGGGTGGGGRGGGVGGGGGVKKKKKKKKQKKKKQQTRIKEHKHRKISPVTD